MEVVFSTVFHAVDDIEVDVPLEIGGTALPYKIRHIIENPYDNACFRINLGETPGVGYIDVVNYKNSDILTGTNRTPLHIATQEEDGGVLEKYYLQMTLQRIPFSGDIKRGSKMESNLWLYSFVILKTSNKSSWIQTK
jgi:hypothetical protein